MKGNVRTKCTTVVAHISEKYCAVAKQTNKKTQHWNKDPFLK